MHFLNLSFSQFLVLFGSVSGLVIALYLLDRSRRRLVVSTLRFWSAAERALALSRRKWIQQPWSLLLQLVSMALLLLAIAQLRWGGQETAPRDHVLILDTSAWMAARSGKKALMELARDKARAYVRAVPAHDRIMLIRADALATPATAFEPNRQRILEAIAHSQPGNTALNLDEALAFARQVQAKSQGRGGEIVFVGSPRIAERETTMNGPLRISNLRVIAVDDAIDNCGLRKVGLRRSARDPELWEVYVSARNYGSTARDVTLAVAFASSTTGRDATPVGSRRLRLPPGANGEASFRFRTRAAVVLHARLLPDDDFPADDHAVLELPAQRLLKVTVYSDQPELLRAVLSADTRIRATYRKTAEYQDQSDSDLLILDRFAPTRRPRVGALWIDPPREASPIPVRARVANVPFAKWHSETPLGTGIRTKDFRLQEASVFETAPSDLRVGEVEGGPVIVARAGAWKTVVLGFHPVLSAMRYELATPLLFANVLRWMAPEPYRRSELSSSSVGSVQVALDQDVKLSDIRILHEDGTPVPFILRDRTLDFFVGTPGTVRVLAGDREYVYSLTLPQMWEAQWTASGEVKTGLPRFRDSLPGLLELWPFLAMLGGAGLLLEWYLFGRFSRGLVRGRTRTVAWSGASSMAAAAEQFEVGKR